MSKSWRLLEIAREICGVEGTLRPSARSVAAGVRVRAEHPPVQGLLLDRGGALPLAVQLLPQLLARPDAGLDERDLSALGARARHHADQPGQLVLADLADEADDGPAGLRRRRQSRSDHAPMARTRRRRSSWSSTAGPIRAISKGGVFSVVVHGDVEGAENVRRALADWLRFMKLKPAGPSRRARPLHRLLEALCDQPRGARQGQGHPGGGPQCGANAAARGAGAARGQVDRCWRGAGPGSPEVGVLVRAAFAP